MIGTTLGHYRIVELLGEGGMGSVYVAEDLHLSRKVALKLLREEVTRDPGRRARFVQEARAAAALEHPHIAAVHDIDEADGCTFIAMELVRGRSLRETMRAQPMDWPRVVDLAIQVAEALARVHECGLVHRDLKPENVLLTEEGYAKIIDFGLAKLVEPSAATGDEHLSELDTRLHTREGTVMGTVAYMSPEQARAGTVDRRSDLFSFGLVLYEMLAGFNPFRRPSAGETISAILRDPAPPLKERGGPVPPTLQHSLRKVLAKDPAERYQDARDLVVDLRTAREELAGRPPRRLRGWHMVAAGGALVAVLGLGLWWGGSRAVPDAPTGPVTMLVADFENRTGEAVFAGALEQALGLGLEGAPFVSCYSRGHARRAAARLDAASEELDEPTARLVSRSEGIGLVVAGSIAPHAEGYEVEGRALDSVTGDVVAESRARARDRGAVLEAVARLAADLRGQLGQEDGAPSGGVLQAETFTTGSLEAMSHYAEAQSLQFAGRYEEAVAEYRQAIEADPEMGRAYSGLAVLLNNTGEREQGMSYFEEGLAHLDRMSDRERWRTLGAYYLCRQEPQAAIEAYENLVEHYPADSAGHANLALAYFYTRNMAGARTQGQRAVDLYPHYVPQRNNLALYALYAGDFEVALREAKAVLEMNPDYEKARDTTALALYGLGRTSEAIEAYGKLAGASTRGASFATIGLADIALFEGRTEDAIRLLTEGAARDAEAGSEGSLARKLAMLAEARLATGAREAAAETAARAIQHSRSPSVLHTAGQVLLIAGRDDLVRELVEDLGGRLEPDPQAYAKVLEGEWLLRDGKPREAVRALHQGQELADTWVGRLVTARAYLAAGAFAQAYSEIQELLRRRGEAIAAYLDDMPTNRQLPTVYYLLGRAQEGLGTPGALESYRTFLGFKEPDSTGPMIREALTRVSALE